MIVDTSALMAIILAEPGHEGLIRKLADADVIGIGAPTLAELGIVFAAVTGREPLPAIARILQEFAITPVPFSDGHWREAVGAYLRYGKGRHPARLNFGDCMTYATARLAGQPLLCTGNDFKRTDLELA